MGTKLSVAVRSDIGRVRQRNEDAFVVADIATGASCKDERVTRFDVGPRGTLLAVSDGMGGHKAGDVASKMTLDSIHRALVARASVADVDTLLVRAAEIANVTVYEAGRQPSLENMGATLTAVLVEDGAAHIAQVGDSRAYLIRGGEIRRLTRDQTFAEEVVRAGAMKESEMDTSPLRNMLLQAVGQTMDLSVAVSVLALRARDCLLLCSDGLTGKLKDEEIRDMILSAPSLDVASQRLVDEANTRGGEDNITALLVGVSGDLPVVAPDDPFSGTYRVLKSFKSVAHPATSHAR